MKHVKGIEKHKLGKGKRKDEKRGNKWTICGEKSTNEGILQVKMRRKI